MDRNRIFEVASVLADIAVPSFGFLVSILLILIGLLPTALGLVTGVDAQQFGIPIILIGAALFLFMIFSRGRLAAIQTFVVIVGVIFMVVGILWIENATLNHIHTATPTWPGFIFIVAGPFLIYFFNRPTIHSMLKALTEVFSRRL